MLYIIGAIFVPLIIVGAIVFLFTIIFGLIDTANTKDKSWQMFIMPCILTPLALFLMASVMLKNCVRGQKQMDRLQYL